MEVTEISLVVDVLLPLGRKQQSLVHGTCGLFTLHTLLKAIVYCLQHTTGGGSDDIRLGNTTRYIDLTSNCIVMPCSVSVNCPAVICLPFMPCCLSKESTSSELWTRSNLYH